MKLNVLIMRALDWPCSMGERLRDWLEAGEKQASQPEINPLARRCYLMSEAHLSGYRLIVGFESLDDLQDAQEFLARRVPPNLNSTDMSR